MRIPYGQALLLIALVCVLYASTLSYGFVYEDLNDTGVFLAPPTWGALVNDLPHRLVTRWTFALSGLISPVEPWGYHLISILFHALNTVLLFALARMVWEGAWLPFVCALLFAVHPLQVESVAYISARADLVMTACVLCALIASERERWGWMLVWSVMAISAKESGIVAAPLALLWACVRWKPVPIWLMSVVGGGAFLGAGVLAWHYGLSGLSLSYTALENAKLWHLLSRVVVPVGLSIDHDYAWWTQGYQWIALAVTGLVGFYALLSTRPWSFGVLFVLVALAPRLLFPLVEGLHEHHMYLPMIGVVFALIGSTQRGQTDGFSETFA